MSRRVLVDTSAWLAVFHRRDQYHGPAGACLRQLRAERARLVVTDLILAELHLHLVRTVGPGRAAAHLETLNDDPLLEEAFTDRELEAAALRDWLQRFPDQAFTLADAVSFAAMRARRVEAAFTFDRHFAVAGFATIPGRL
ncbi:MAG: type II toxin-antitoxin system VapC family toxin [Gemmatimonadales bacterium]